MAGILVAPLSASAVEYGGLGAKPSNPDLANPRTQSIFVYTLKPGEQKTDALTVYNNTNQRKVVSVYAVDSQTSSGGAFACAQKVDSKQDVGSWVTLADEEIALNPGQKQSITFDLNIPANAGVGEHDGCLVVQEQTTTTKQQSGVALSFRSALRMVVTIPGKTFKKLSYVGLSHMSKEGNQILRPSIKNEGNVSVDGEVKASLKNVFGFTVGKAGGTYPILPKSQAEWNFEIKSPIWGGLYVATTAVSYDASDRPLGVTGGPRMTIKGPSKTFFLAPKPAAAALELLIILALAAMTIILRRRTTDRRQALQHWQSYTVKKSDSLQALAATHNVSWKQIARINKLKAPYALTPGQAILLPNKKV